MARIYIVDDDQDIVESVSMVLKKQGHDVAFQTDESDVIANVAKFNSELVILDVMFPENASAGFDMARDLKGNSETKDIPILMLSAINEKNMCPGSFSNKDRDESWLPVEEFMEKPIEPQVLIEKTNMLLGL